VGVERFVEFLPQVENLIRYHVPSHHTPIWVPDDVSGVKNLNTCVMDYCVISVV